MDLEKIIELAKILANPYKITTYILAVLLILSIAGNIYLATQSYTIDVMQDYDNSDQNVNDIG